jgi:hypothetical protein
MTEYKVKCEVVMDGPGPMEKLVKVQTSDGFWEEVIVGVNSVVSDMVGNYLLKTSRILAEDQERVLVELPRESVSGNWRLWVPRAAFG